MNKIEIVLFVYLFLPFIFPQEATNWKTYTDMKLVRDIEGTNEGVWSATSGGAFYYSFLADSFFTLKKTDGLNGTSLTTVAIDNDKIWFGSTNGIIDIYNRTNNKINSILDIYIDSDKSLKQINDLFVYSDTIIASSDFGISLINSNDLVFYDTYSKFGNLPSNTKVNSAAKYDLIYICTDAGIVIQKPGAVNLSAPESWDVFQTSHGLPSNKIVKMDIYNGSVVAATDKGLSIFNGSTWSSFIPELLNTDIKDIKMVNGSLYILTANSIFSYSNNALDQIYNANLNLTNLAFSNQNGVLAGSFNGIVQVSNAEKLIVPNGPLANQFIGLTVDNNNILWVASGSDPRGVGFFKYDGNSWTNYNVQNIPQLPSNSYFIAYAAPDNSKYFGNWGNGFIKFTDEQVKVFTTSNTDLEGIDQGPDYLVISGFATDSRNNLWILNSEAVNKKTLSMLTPDSMWYHFTIPAAQNIFLETQYHLAIDQYDTKWYCSQDANKKGLFYFNENKTYDSTSTSDDKSGFLNESSGLNDNTVTAVVVDRRGDVWVGTSFGVNIIYNTNTILSSTPQLRVFSVFALRQQSINCIAVDPLNQKWIGTNQGLLLVNSDGSQLIATFDSRNSPILADEIRSIAIDENSGRIYVGTDAGLTSFDTPSIKPVDSFSELFIYPSPFVIDDKNNFLTIDGLIRESDIKILNISGKLINEFSSPGGRIAFWDGRNSEGELVHTGVYLIVAFDKEGNSVATSKIAVLRK